MRVWLLYDPANSEGLVDGDEFRRQCDIAADYYRTDHFVDTYEIHGETALMKRQALFRHIRTLKDRMYDRIIFFCHGAPYNLNRMMISEHNIATFSLYLDRIATPGGAVVFFSCRTAEKDDGFAQTVATLSDCDVIGHSTSGHTARNPYKVLFVGGSGRRFDLWETRGGTELLRARLYASATAPFEFVEEILTDI